MRRTTVALDDDLFRELKQQAARDGVTFGHLVNRILRRGLRTRPRGKFEFRLTTAAGRVREGVDLDDTGALLDLTDERP